MRINILALIFFSSTVCANHDDLETLVRELTERLSVLEQKSLHHEERIEQLEGDSFKFTSEDPTETEGPSTPPSSTPDPEEPTTTPEPDDSIEERISKLEQLSRIGTLRSCSEYARYGLEETGAYIIDPDGPLIGQEPFQVFCNFTSGSTEIYHDTE